MKFKHKHYYDRGFLVENYHNLNSTLRFEIKKFWESSNKIYEKDINIKKVQHIQNILAIQDDIPNINMKYLIHKSFEFPKIQQIKNSSVYRFAFNFVKCNISNHWPQAIVGFWNDLKALNDEGVNNKLDEYAYIHCQPRFVINGPRKEINIINFCKNLEVNSNGFKHSTVDEISRFFSLIEFTGLEQLFLFKTYKHDYFKYKIPGKFYDDRALKNIVLCSVELFDNNFSKIFENPPSKERIAEACSDLIFHNYKLLDFILKFYC